MAKEILLTKGKVAIVDDADYEYLSRWKWQVSKQGYARRTYYNNGKRTKLFMHLAILQPPPGFIIDHINGNSLDNRRENLRLATPSQNNANRHRPNPKIHSQYKGVTLDTRRHRWYAQISHNDCVIHIGTFTNELEAAKAYDAKAKEFFGEFAYTNLDAQLY